MSDKWLEDQLFHFAKQQHKKNNQQITEQNRIKEVPKQIQNLLKSIQKQQLNVFDQILKITSKQTGHGMIAYPLKLIKKKKQLDKKKENQNQKSLLVQLKYIQQGLWTEIKLKIISRINRYKNKITNIQEQHYINEILLVSDLLIWSIPNFCSYFIAIKTFIRKWKQSISMLTFSKKSFADKSEQPLELQQQQKTLIDLQKPLQQMKQFFNLFSSVKSYYQSLQTQYEQFYKINRDQLNQQKCQKIRHFLNLSRLQQKQIVKRLNEVRKIFHDIQKGQTLDRQVYKNRLILHQYPLMNVKLKVFVKFGIKAKFNYILRKRAKKTLKRLQQRDNLILQLIQKQKLYIDTLAIYIQHVKRPIQSLNIINDDERKKLFCNIQQIKGIHEVLYNKLKVRYQQHQKYQVYGDILKQIVPFFKMYVQYQYILFQGAQGMMTNLMNQHQNVKQICDKFFLLSKKKASDQLNQPHQKIFSYQLHFTQMLKKTNPTHKDYGLFEVVKVLLKKNLSAIQTQVNSISKSKKFYQLQQQFGTTQQPIFKQKRVFLEEQSCFLVKQQKNIPIKILCFDDLILIIQQTTRKKLKYINVDQKFYIRKEQDNKIYKNMIKIHSAQGFTTLTTGNQYINFQKAERIYQILKNIQCKTENNQLVYVQVLGTQQIGSTSFAKYTQYIIQIKYISLKKLLHLRFSDIFNIVKNMQTHYKHNLSITQEQTLKKTWFNNHKSKTIQDRKRTIQQILQKLFNHQVVRTNPKYLLSHLNLSQKFFQTARKISLQRNSQEILATSIMTSLQKMESMGIGQSFLGWSPTKKDALSTKQLKQAVTILCATELKLGRDIYHDMQVQVQNKKQKAQKVDIFINTMKQDQSILVKITEYDTVQDVCNKVSKLLGLRQNRDFRLFHEIGKKQLRVLQHQQVVLKLFTFPKNVKRQSVQGFFQSMTSSIKKVISPDTHPTLIFKKYYFLPFQIEQRQAKKDLTRLRLLTYQIFSQVRDMKYQLNFEQYLFFTALLIFIQHDGQFQNKNIDNKIVHKIIPQTIFKLKNYTQQEWIDKVMPHINRLQQQIKKVIEYNKQKLKKNKIRTDTHSKMSLYFGNRHLASQLVLNKIKSNPIY